MSQFTDAAGQTHALAITFGQVVGGLKAAGLDLAAGDHEQISVVLYANPFALVRCVQVLAPTASFEGAGPDVLNAASTALHEAILDFFLRPLARYSEAGATTNPGSSNPSGGSPVCSD